MTAPLVFPDDPPRPTPANPPPPGPLPTPGPPPSVVGQGEDAHTRAALDQVSQMLVAGERVLSYAIQRRLFALTHRRILIAATTGRLIAINRPILGGFRPVDVRWQDLKNVATRAGIFGADLQVSAMAQPDFASQVGQPLVFLFRGLRKDQAAEVYRIAQGQEQSWREKRRAREIEETRARSGGIQLGAGGFGSAGSLQEDPAARLARAKVMLDQGLIGDSEYETIKAKILSEF